MEKMKLLKNCLQTIIENIDCGNSKISEEECEELLDAINKATNVQNKLSKYQAIKYLGISRATFDNLVKEGKIPKGKKEQGFKELFWEKKVLDEFKNNKLR